MFAGSSTVIKDLTKNFKAMNQTMNINLTGVLVNVRSLLPEGHSNAGDVALDVTY
jgi:hypothetical protein